VRILCSISVSWALFLCLLEAPFVHVHEQASGDAHHATEQAHVHARLRSANAQGLAIEQLDPADDEHPVNWFQTVRCGSFALFVEPQNERLTRPANRREFLLPAPVACGHSPPFFRSIPPRAPPVTPT